jgi:hypothetical protein
MVEVGKCYEGCKQIVSPSYHRYFNGIVRPDVESHGYREFEI